jgi:uncharacterized protein with von Willebrand factor type A (vWA) domain
MNENFLYNIVTFLALLKEEGFFIAPTEAGDVARVLAAVQIYEREQVRLALRATLAKSPKQQRVFDRLFEEFFISEQTMFEQYQQTVEEEAERLRKIEESREELGDDVSEEVAEVYADAPTSRQDWLKNMLELSRSEKRNSELMDAYLNKLARGWMVPGAGVGLRPVEEEEDDEEDDLMHKEFSQISEEETARALHLIELLISRLNRNLERKYKRKGRSGMPDVRATIHASLRTGGIPMKPMYKKRPHTSRSLVLLCDVSESMLRFSGFALRFISGLTQSSGKMRAFIFSEGAEEIASYDYDTFQEVVRKSDLWRLGTDIGNALGYLQNLRPPVLQPNASLIVLSDAWTVNRQLVLERMEECAKQTRQIIWLNPDRTQNDLIPGLEKYCLMLGVGSLDDLIKACASITL